MSDSKKYYYLKLKENFFDSEELMVLESMPDGYMYSNILLKLYLRGVKNNGKLMVNERIPYNSTMLSNVTRHPTAVVEKAIQTFIDLGLIEVMENGAIYLLDIQNFIGESSTEADRKRLYRTKIEAEKKLLTGQMSGQNDAECPDKAPPELEIDIELEKELEIDKDPPKSPSRKLTKSKRLETPTVQKHQYAEFVAMTNDEYQSLVDNERLGTQTAVNRCIEILDNYKGANGKKYKSDYRAILTWVIDEYEERQRKHGARPPKGGPQNGSPENPQAAMAQRAIEMLKQQEANQDDGPG